MASIESKAYQAPIIYKSFAILKEIANAPGVLGMSDISRLLNLNKSTVYGVMKAFLDLGILRQEENRKFKLGQGLIQLSNQSLAGISLKSIAHPFMIKIARDFAGTVFLGRFDELGITIIETADSPVEMKISAPVGTRLPFFAGAAAMSYLASLDETAQRKIISERNLPKFTENSVVDVEKYLAQLIVVREQGYAIDFEEYIRGVNAVSVPLNDKFGMFLGAIWIVGFSNMLSEEKMRRAAAVIMEAAREIKDIIG